MVSDHEEVWPSRVPSSTAWTSTVAERRCWGGSGRDRRGEAMIVCWRTAHVPPQQRERFLAWIEENRQVREDHGILFELVLERSTRQNPPKTLQPTDQQST